MPENTKTDTILTASVDDQRLQAVAEQQISQREKAKLRALAKVATGMPVKQAARTERVSRKTLNATIAVYNHQGLEGILPRRRGRPPALTDQQIIKTRDVLLHERPMFQAWTPLLLSLWLKEQFGVRYRPDALAKVAAVITDGKCVLPEHVLRRPRTKGTK